MRSTRHAIVEAAMRCFARDGFGVALRPIGEEAGVSAALIVHHFGSKQGLRDAVDDHVVGIVEEKLRAFEVGGIDAATAVVLPLYEEGVLPRYLMRVLAERDDAGRRLFEAFVDVTEKGLAELALPDPRMTAALLVTHSLGAMFLADAVGAAADVDLLATDGLARWRDAAIAIYRGDLGAIVR